MDNIRKDLMIKSGLGEEVISSLRKEKYIKTVSNKLQEMIDNDINVDEMSRKIVDIILKDKNDEQF